MNLSKQLLTIPKIELHLHLDGSVKPETLLELAQKEAIELPTTDLAQLREYVSVAQDCKSLQNYLEKFDFPQIVMQRCDNLERIAYELCEIVSQENVRYFEVRFAPQFHTEKGLSLDEIVQAVLTGLKRGEKDYNLKTGLILCSMRHQDAINNMEVVELAGRFKGRGVVAIDLAGSEAQYPVENHAQIFKRAKELGLHITIHAGEAAGAGSVAKALELGAERIGHGVRINEDLELLEWVKEHQILLEVCPISNLQTKVVQSIMDHPVKIYFDQGIKVSINTDNRTVSNTSLVKEYEKLINELGFSVDEIKQMNLYAAEEAFLPTDEKIELIRRLKQEMGV